MAFIPNNQQLQALLNQIVDPNRFAGTFDAAFKNAKAEQENAIALLGLIAQADPEVAANLAISTGVTEAPQLFDQLGIFKPKGQQPTPSTQIRQQAGTITSTKRKPGTFTEEQAFENMRQFEMAVQQENRLRQARGESPIAITPEARRRLEAGGRPSHAAVADIMDEETFSKILGSPRLSQDELAAEEEIAQIETQRGKPLTPEERADIRLLRTKGITRDDQQVRMQAQLERSLLQLQIAELSLKSAALEQLLTERGKPLSKKEVNELQNRQAALIAEQSGLQRWIDGLEDVLAGNIKDPAVMRDTLIGLVGGIREGLGDAAATQTDIFLRTLQALNDPRPVFPQLRLLLAMLKDRLALRDAQIEANSQTLGQKPPRDTAVGAEGGEQPTTTKEGEAKEKKKTPEEALVDAAREGLGLPPTENP
jgi:hypothetical protein